MLQATTRLSPPAIHPSSADVRPLHLCAHCSSLRSSQNVRNCAAQHHVQSSLIRNEQQHRRRVVCRRQAQTRTHTSDIRAVAYLVPLFLPARAAGLFMTLLYVRLVAAAGFFRIDFAVSPRS